MYLILSPFFYYIANQDAIENYVTIESGGEHPHLMPYRKLKPIIERFIENNSHGVDQNYKEKYVMFICDKLALD